MYIVRSLAGGWEWKVVGSAAIVLFDRISGLFIHNELLVAALAILVAIDFVTGVLRAFRRRKFRTIWFRQTLVKVLEYALLLFVVQLIANAFPVVSWIGPTAYLYCCLTEAASIFENVYGSTSKAKAVWVKIRDEIERRGGVQEEGGHE